MEGPLFNLTSVWLIDLHSNMLQGQILLFLSPFIYYLDYSENNFSSSMLTDIGEYFSDGTAFFSISSNNLSGIIPESICNSPYLEVLDMSNNSFTGTVPQCVTTMTQ
ncbi:putative non-specific serine/threonine protein kinase [Rosa chinensis]|uniref:Putative non-specific serine/threonine protein kinase n=1 Tax=Rosa chinensis TaxID=74649 RepID=A0A2P6R965_ROSCH|nr:putative non-specific serine/threonine protein kinase [Rosa chinensis]